MNNESLNELNNTETFVSDAEAVTEKQRKALEKHEETVKELTGKTKKRKIFMVIFLIASALIIALTALNEFGGNKESASPGEVLSVWAQNWYYVVFAFACMAVLLFCETMKFAMFLKKITGRFNFKLAWKCMIQGKYYDGITPSAIGGQPFQIYYLTKSGINAGKSTSIAITCFFLTQFTFSVTAITFMSVFGNSIPSISQQEGLLITGCIGAVLATLVPVLMIFASFIPKTAKRICDFFIRLLVKIKIVKDYDKARESALDYIDNYSNSVKHMSTMKGTLTINFLLSVLGTFANASIPYFVILCCGAELPYVEVITMCLLTYSTVAFIPTPGSSGAAEAGFYIVFQILSGGFLFMGMLLWRFISFYVVLLIGMGVVIAGYSKNGIQRVKYGTERNEK